MRTTEIVPAPRIQRRHLMFITLCVAVLIVQIDTSVVNLAVGPISHYFGSEVRALQWVFAIAFPMLLLGIFIGDRLQARITNLAFKRIVSTIFIASGLALVVK